MSTPRHHVQVGPVALVGLDLLARLEEVTQNFVENCYVGILTGRVWSLDPHQVPCKDVDAQLVAQGELPRVLVGREGVPLNSRFPFGEYIPAPVLTL